MFLVESKLNWGKPKTARTISSIFLAFPRSLSSYEERSEFGKISKVPEVDVGGLVGGDVVVLSLRIEYLIISIYHIFLKSILVHNCIRVARKRTKS